MPAGVSVSVLVFRNIDRCSLSIKIVAWLLPSSLDGIYYGFSDCVIKRESDENKWFKKLTSREFELGNNIWLHQTSFPCNYREA